ncbi:MAG: hypothetical protein WKF66_13565 [Pedobacter sp.]
MTSTLKSFLSRLVLSLFLGHFFASAGQSYTLMELINAKHYVAALLTGTLCSLLISYLITFLTTFLNKRFPWNSFRILRPGIQLITGIAFPFLIIFLLMMLYFAHDGFWILDTGWPEHCAGYVVLVLCLANLGSEMLATKVVPVAPLMTDLPFITALAETHVTVVCNPVRFKGRLFTEIVHVYAVNRVNFAMFADGDEHRLPYTISKAMTLLSPETHLRLSRCDIVMLSQIEKARYMKNEKVRIRIYLKGIKSGVIVTSENYTTKALKEILRPYLAVGDGK